MDMKTKAPASVDVSERTKYGGFSQDGREYVISRYDTPRPWVNVLCNDDPGYGVVLSQAGGGYSWLVNAELNRITKWEQDLVQDRHGKFLYVRDRDSGEVWSAAFQPVCRIPSDYECRHGIGYTTITSTNCGIRSMSTHFVPPGVAAEVWLVEITNLSHQSRSLSVISYLEWCLGTAHDTHREFHRSFMETEAVAKEGVLLARKRLWAIGNDKGQGWNREWDGTAFHACTGPMTSFECDKEAFIGMYRSLANPRAAETGELTGSCGKWGDPVASIRTDIEIGAGQTQILVFTTGWGASREQAMELAGRFGTAEAAAAALEDTKQWWLEQLDGFHASTPDDDLNTLLNYWLRYQAMAGRIWGRTGYYQPGGAYGFRDQLQDSQVFLPTQPERTRRQILLHARHQFTKGNVFHWWQPITETGAHSRFSDDLLWLPFVLSSYLNETADYGILDEPVPYVDGPAEPLVQHCFRAIDLSLSRFSPRGLPLIGEGDWNDGLSAVGWDEQGESVWVGMFLGVILPEWAGVAARLGDPERGRRYRSRAGKLRESINNLTWDGQWYVRATCDDGTVLGSRECREGQIFLNPQIWSIISGTCPEERRQELMETVRRLLYSDFGPLLLRPAYTQPDARIGYLTRYAPGCRENGGVYVHAANWAIWAECLMGRPDMAWSIYERISPAVRGRDPDLYRSEPYVTPGNVDGPGSPNHGRGGWTWYTGSAAWLFRVMTEWVLGVRPEAEGLRIDPCIPDGWPGFSMRRRFRGCSYLITVRTGAGGFRMLLDGRAVSGHVLPALDDGGEHTVEVDI